MPVNMGMYMVKQNHHNLGRIGIAMGTPLPLPPATINKKNWIGRWTSWDKIVHNPYLGLTFMNPRIICVPCSCYSNLKQYVVVTSNNFFTKKIKIKLM